MHDDLDYSRLKRSLEFFVVQYVPENLIKPDSHPVELLKSDEQRNPTRARRRLSIAIGDFVEATQGFPLNMCWRQIWNWNAAAPTRFRFSARAFPSVATRSNQSMKPTSVNMNTRRAAPFRYNPSVFATTPYLAGVRIISTSSR